MKDVQQPARTAPAVAVVIPSFNEGGQIADTLNRVLAARGDRPWEIIVVDDGSTDDTAEKLKAFGDRIRVIRHRSNHGYGAALKTGILSTRARNVVFIDADGQHSPDLLPRMVELLEDHEFVMGERQTQAGIPFIRKPGKLVLKLVVSFLVGRRIEDVNCGFRGGRRRLYLRMLELLPDGFSFSTTSLVYAIKSRYLVTWLPVPSQARKGFSTVRIISDGIKTLLLALRLVMLFDPLRAFVLPAFFLMLIGVVYQVYILAATGLHVVGGAILSLLAGIILFHFGLLADQIASLRKEMSAQIGMVEEEKDLARSEEAGP
ncbi:MAG: glycosyltransferase family 2 protein [Kiritimatiellae bacterium]|nr:glycosyltransferase family 2 protein [Kiritimatiellia bacterium]